MEEQVLKHRKFCDNCNNCPEGELVNTKDGQFVVIRDDYGNKVKLTPDQFKDILKAGSVLLPS